MANTASGSGLPNQHSTSTAQSNPVLENVRSRAYELYESRGREDGHDLDDWLVAEQQIMRDAVVVAR